MTESNPEIDEGTEPRLGRIVINTLTAIIAGGILVLLSLKFMVNDSNIQIPDSLKTDTVINSTP